MDGMKLLTSIQTLKDALIEQGIEPDFIELPSTLEGEIATAIERTYGVGAKLTHLFGMKVYWKNQGEIMIGKEPRL